MYRRRRGRGRGRRRVPYGRGRGRGRRGVQAENIDTRTHFLSLPLNFKIVKDKCLEIRQELCTEFGQRNVEKVFQWQKVDRIHCTLCMLDLNNPYHQLITKSVLQTRLPDIQKILGYETLDIPLKSIEYFGMNEKTKIPKIVFFGVDESKPVYKKMQQISNLLIGDLVAYGVIPLDQLRKSDVQYDEKTDTFSTMKYHMTYSRVNQMAMRDPGRGRRDPRGLFMDTDSDDSRERSRRRRSDSSESGSRKRSRKSKKVIPVKKTGLLTLEEMMMKTENDLGETKIEEEVGEEDEDNDNSAENEEEEDKTSHIKKGKRLPDFNEIKENYKNTNFGTYTVQTIDISTRFHYDEEGFYLPYFRMPLYDDENDQKEEKNEMEEEEKKEEEDIDSQMDVNKME